MNHSRIEYRYQSNGGSKEVHHFKILNKGPFNWPICWQVKKEAQKKAGIYVVENNQVKKEF